jgi:hypothetical protein
VKWSYVGVALEGVNAYLGLSKDELKGCPNEPVCKRGFDWRHVTPGTDRKLLSQLAGHSVKALKAAQAAGELASHLKM